MLLPYASDQSDGGRVTEHTVDLYVLVSFRNVVELSCCQMHGVVSWKLNAVLVKRLPKCGGEGVLDPADAASVSACAEFALCCDIACLKLTQ